MYLEGSLASLVVQMVKKKKKINPPAMQETWVRSLGWEDLEEDMTIHSSFLAWRIPMDRGAWRAAVHRVAKSQTRLEQLSTHTGFPGGSAIKNLVCQVGDSGSIPKVGKIPWRRKWQPTPVFLPGKSHGQRSLVGYGPWGRKESAMTE